MAARLIINADDFGLTPGVNRAIAELHRGGVLNSATLMATGPAFDDAVRLALSLPTLGVGCHIVLTDGTPASPTADIPTLLGPDRRTFRPTLGSFVRDLFLGLISETEIAHEATAQIQKLQCAGIPITHVDTHKHTHLFPRVARPLLLAAQHCGIQAIRNPFEPPWNIALNRTPANRLRLLQLHLLGSFKPGFQRLLERTPTVRSTNGTLGIALTGSLDASSLYALLSPPLADDEDLVYELCCHPGYNDADLDRITTRLRAHREIERAALLTEIPRILMSPHAPQLIHYGNLFQ